MPMNIEQAARAAIGCVDWDDIVRKLDSRIAKYPWPYPFTKCPHCGGDKCKAADTGRGWRCIYCCYETNRG